jgi:lipid-binding SYLF domain-containing protein
MLRSMFALGLALLTATPALAADRLSRRVEIASEVVTNRMTSALAVPDWVLDHAKCVASLKVVKVGFIWGGEGSTGLVSCRTADGSWSEPSFFNVGGVNFGIQIGVQLIESVLVFVTDESREILNHASFEIGADISFAAGPVGGGGGAGQMPNASILSYQRTVGLYAGATVNGFILSHGTDRDAEVYGDVEPSVLLDTAGAQAPAVMQPFVTTLTKYMP